MFAFDFFNAATLKSAGFWKTKIKFTVNNLLGGSLVEINSKATCTRPCSSQVWILALKATSSSEAMML